MSSGTIRRVAIVGAASQIGQALLPCLEAAAIAAVLIGRRASPDASLSVHVFDDAHRTFEPSLSKVDAVISLAPLPVIGRVLDMAEALGARRVIAFGSTGRFSKVDSSSEIERDFVAQQTQAEHLLATRSERAGIAWTLFRPTMIYGADVDLNVSFIRSIIRRFGFFPIPWGANGRRQPVHVDDLATACLAALSSSKTFDRAYDLGGGEVLHFPDLVKRVFKSEQRHPFLLPIPLWIYVFFVGFLSKFPEYSFIRQEMVHRMFRDLTADNRAAFDDFSYQPQSFRLVSRRR